MADDVKTYQPGWGEKKKHHHHHHHHHEAEQNRGLGGALRMKDKQAYYGLMFVLVLVALFGAYTLVMLFVNEIRKMPGDDPTTEMNVDELKIHRVDQQNALLLGDSLAQTYQIDSVRHVQRESVPVYRPPRKENKWYITWREWKDIWRAYKVKRFEKKREQQ